MTTGIRTQTGRRPGKTEQKKQKKRADLLRSAYELFTTVGYQKTSISDIARKAGVGKGTFYLYYEDKEDIHNALTIQKSSELLRDAWEKLNRNMTPEMDFTDKLLFVADYILEKLSHNIALLKFISKSLSKGMMIRRDRSDTSDRTRASNQAAEDLQNFVLELIAKDGVNLRDPETLIFTVIELVNATCYNVILYGEPKTFSEYKPYLFHCIRLLVEDSTVSGSAVHHREPVPA